MYKFTGDNEDKLTFLVGKGLQQLCYGLYDIQFHFEDELSISIYNKIMFYSSSKEEVVLEINSKSSHSPIQINSLLGQKISKYEIVNHESIILSFENAEKIFIDGGDLEFECYTINYRGAVYVI
jgi:hypothetical protein